MERQLGGEECAVAPVLFWKHHPVDDQDGAALCRATLDFQRRFDCDIIKISPAATYQLPDYGLRDAWLGDPMGRRTVTRTVVCRPDDWLLLPRIDPDGGFTARFGECVRAVRRATSSEVPVIITVFDPMSQAVTLAGRASIGNHLATAPDAVTAGLLRITENTVALIEHLTARGADGIFLASQHAARNDFPRNVVERYSIPGIQACLDAMRGTAFDMVHCHGHGIHRELLAAMAGVTVHYDMWADNPPPQALLDNGSGVATGPSPVLLASPAPDDEVIAACTRALEAGGRTILSPGCSVPLSVGEQRLRILSATARRSTQT